VREIRTLRAMWRALETGSRQVLNGHEGGNPGHKPRMSLRATAPVLDPTTSPASVEAENLIRGITRLIRLAFCPFSNQRLASQPPAFSCTVWRRPWHWVRVAQVYAWQRPHLDTASRVGRRFDGLSCRPASGANPLARSHASCRAGVCQSRCAGDGGVPCLRGIGEHARRGHERRIVVPGNPGMNMRVLH
jgi:hypothetical protein